MGRGNILWNGARLLCVWLACSHSLFGIPSSSSLPGNAAQAVDDAVRETTERPVILFFAPAASDEARHLEEGLFKDPDVAARLAAFQLLRVDPEKDSTLAGRWRVRDVPALLKLDVLGKEVDRWIAPGDRESLLLFLSSLEGPAVEREAVAKPALQRFETSPVDKLQEADWVEILSSMAADDSREIVRGAFRSKKPFPAQFLITYLEHPLLVVRSGAIDLLEDAAQENFDYDPWKSPAENAEALAKWKEWAKIERTPAKLSPPSADELPAIVADLISDDLEKELRGRRALEAGDEETEGQLLEMEGRTTTAGPRNRIREARYTLLLRQGKVPNAGAMARQLVQGSLDARVSNLSQLDIGKQTLPIITDFLASPEPLEREAAVEALGKIGSSEAAGLLVRHRESNLNVRHAMLRQAAKLKTDESLILLANHISDPSEDLAVTALEGLALAEAKDQADAIGAALKDPRWRVRVAALTAVEKLSLSKFSAEVKLLLDDPDEFVRISAIGTAGRLKITGLDNKAIELFRDREELRPALVVMFTQAEKPLPKEIVQQLAGIGKESMLSILGAMREVDAHSQAVVQVAVKSSDADVAAAGLRKVASGEISNPFNIRTMIAALDTGDLVKQRAVLGAMEVTAYALENLNPGSGSPRFGGGLMTEKPGLELMERMAAAFSGGKNQEPATVAALAGRIRKVLPTLPEEDRVNAAVALLTLGDDSIAPELETKLTLLTDGQRDQLAGAIRSVRSDRAISLIRRLLQDPSQNVRDTAARSLLEEPDFRCYEILVEELEKPDSKLVSSPDLLSSLGERMGNLQDADRVSLRKRFLRMIREGSSPALRIFGLYGLRGAWEPTTCSPVVEWAMKDSNPYIRRAAADTLAQQSPARFAELASVVAKDSSPLVRQVIPEFAAFRSHQWLAYLSEAEVTGDYRSSYGDERNARQKELNAEIKSLLKQLAKDPDPATRLLASLSLVELKEPVDVDSLLEAMKNENISREVASALESFGQEGIASVPPEYARLFAAAEGIDLDIANLAKARFAQAIVKEAAPVSRPSSSSAIQAPPLAPAKPAKVPLVFFIKPGCHHCEEVASMLSRLREGFPEVEVAEFNINKNRSLELNEHLSKQFNVPQNLRLIAPAIFMPGGYLIRDDISEERIATLVLRSRGKTLELPDEANAPQALQEAGLEIEKRYSQVNLGVIAAAGALDGLNPCAFATIIFLLSYLQIARRTRAEILQVGISYIAGVFITYFLLGLGLTEVVAKIKLLRGVASLLNLAMGAFALVVAILSILDAIKCLQGRMGEMTLQLPGLLKERIHGVIRGTARHRKFVVFAFAVGAVISLLELACTGQVYAPTILYMLQSGEQGAAGYLLIYNLAFIAPLSAVFLCAVFGMGSARLTEFLQQRAALVKFATALLFLVLAFFLIGREL